jgi:hypothetical protein
MISEEKIARTMDLATTTLTTIKELADVDHDLLLTVSLEDLEDGPGYNVFHQQPLTADIVERLSAMYWGGFDLGDLDLAVGYMADYGHVLPIHSLSIRQLPGCCAVAVFTAAHTMHYPYHLRGRGIATAFLPFAEHLTREVLRYSQVFATDVSGSHTHHILTSAGWADVEAIRNVRTGNSVTSYLKTL